MKYLPSQLAFFFTEREMRTNLRGLLQYIAFLVAMVALYTVLFHLIMFRLEGQEHSWISGLYWTVVTMSTLGFGDIVFRTDVGRAFSVVVIMSGVVFLLVMLPFLFIRLFYAPWLEARMRMRAPRQVEAGTRDHVIITEYDAVAAGLIGRLKAAGQAYFVIEPDPARAAQLTGEGISAVTGEIDSKETYQNLEVEQARLVVVNREDTTNTNITLTVREVSAQVPILAIVEEPDAVDVLQLSGATYVLPLKQQLGAYLANRVDTGRIEAHVVGTYRTLQVAELPARGTPFAGQTVRDTRMRETTGMSVVGVWERGRLKPAYPNTVIAESSVVVVAGDAEQVATLNGLLPPSGEVDRPVLVIGAGRVGQAAVEVLHAKGIRTHVLDRDRRSLYPLEGIADRLTEGDAADRRTLTKAGLQDAPSVLLTTNDDAMNIYLAVYCRRLKSDLRIVSRVTHDRNVEAIHRAGADFVLSYASLGAEAIFSRLRGHELVILGEGVDLFTRTVPQALAGRTLKDGAIGSLTGLCVMAVQDGDQFNTELHSETVLPAGAVLVMMGSLEQRAAFTETYGAAKTGPI
ncbi:MAG: NAD-binding protein [Vicinamibacterales bacterium]|nr:NAD-binding protein [Vicinamibacterales bacterium]